MQKDILFDNIYIGHSIEDADKLKAATFDLKKPVEKSEEEASRPKPEEPESPSDIKFTDDPVKYVKAKVDLFITLAKVDPVDAIKSVPEVAGGAAGLVILVLAILIGAVGGGAKAAPSKEQLKAQAQKAKDAAVDAKDKAAEAIATGADKAQEATKRTTRSQASS
jgi:calnexin